MNDDLIPLIDDTLPEDRPSTGPAWRVLIIDDDPEVHRATRFVLDRQRVLGRPLQIESVFSAAEAQTFLTDNPDVAVAFLDVVMETSDAGLRLVETLRGEMGLRELRIILRTGQAGYAPEMDVIDRYDINDYRTKSELTHARLITSLTSALRSYQQIHQLNTSRHGLNQIIAATQDLLSYNGFQQFANGVLTQISAVLDLGAQDGLIVFSLPRQSSIRRHNDLADGAVVAATGRFKSYQSKPLTAVQDELKLGVVSHAHERHESVFLDQCFALACDGQQYSLLVYLEIDRPLREDERQLLSVFGQNITLSSDNLALIEHLHTQAYEDPLTGLPNRLALTARLATALEAPQGRMLALLDVDNFNTLYESVGQDSAEHLLQSFARTLRTRLGEHADLIARIGGDTFAIVGDASGLTETRLAEVLHVDVKVAALTLTVRSSAALIPLDAAPFTPERLMSAAHATIKEAKHTNRGHVARYRNGLIEEIHDNAALLQALTQALDTEAFHLVYQPKWDLRAHRVCGIEALIRWRGAPGGDISPARFIPLPESSGLIVRLGQWVLGKACEEYAALRTAGHAPGPIAINVSGGQFRDDQFLPTLVAALHRFAIAPGDVILEITETAAINNGLDEAMARLQALRDLGVQVALDDFGTSYSSLSYLQRFPVNQLKIDRDFTQTVRSDKGREVIRSIIQVSHALKLSVVAEGAEQMDEVVALEALGCDSIQGYVYARPMPLAELTHWLAGPDAVLNT